MTQIPAWLAGIEGDFLPPLIMSDEPVIRVVAGPGSGKTEGLRRRTRRLIESDGLAPSRILVGTFTRAIAQDLREELDADIKVATLHSLAYEMLRANPTACKGLQLRFLLGYEEDVMLYDITSEVAHLSTQRQRQDALLRQQSARSERNDLPDAKFAGAVDRWLRTHGGMLVGEVVHLALQGLDSGDIPGGTYSEVIVDEYQDLTAAEQELVEMVWSRERSLVVLGDNDQSIYSFRYNHPGGVDEFVERWKDSGVQDLTIPENRRCGESIVNLANQMMAEGGSSKAPMASKSGRLGRVDLVHWPSVDEEVDGLADYLQGSDAPFLVLVPRRFIGHKLKDKIGTDAETAFHQDILRLVPVQERFAAASLVADPTDRVAVRAWLAFHGAKPEQADQRNFEAYGSFGDMDGSRLDLTNAILSEDIKVSGAGKNNLKARAKLMSELLDELSGLDLTDQIDQLFDPALAAGDTAEKERWAAEDLRLLRAAAHKIVEDDDVPDLRGVLSRLRYRIATRARLAEIEGTPRIQIMTLHSAKGLQAENIVIAGLADEMVPGYVTEQARREEQRRLIYVAITRAKDSVVVSWPRTVRYDLAKGNQVRITPKATFTLEGEKVVGTGRSSLLPSGLGGAVAGADWLDALRRTA